MSATFIVSVLTIKTFFFKKFFVHSQLSFFNVLRNKKFCAAKSGMNYFIWLRVLQSSRSQPFGNYLHFILDWLNSRISSFEAKLLTLL